MALDANGLQIKRFPEILSDLVDSERANIDPNIDTRDDELLGQLNQIFSGSLADIWEQLQAVYDSANVLKAEGVHLDNLAALIGITRLSGAKSNTPDQIFIGTNGTTVSQGTVLRNPITLDQFSVDSAVSLRASSCISAKYSVKELLNTTEYTIAVNGVSYDYTSDGDATELEILNGLESEISADTSATWTATVDTLNLQLIITTSNDENIAISSTTFIGADEITNSGSVSALEDGAISAPPNSVTQIVTGVSGLTSTTNPNAYTLGRERETDEELRARILVSQSLNGVATVEAIQDKLRNVVGVTTAIVIENDQILFDGGSAVVTFTNATDTVDLTAHGLVSGTPIQLTTTGTLPTGLLPQSTQYWVINPTANDFQLSLSVGGSAVTFTDDGTGTNTILIGRPPKSFEAIVQGGTDDDVATTIWLTKAAGIEPFGTGSTIITDSNGNQQTINYTRPAPVHLAFLIEYTKYDEESFPITGEDTIATIVEDTTEDLGVDVDVIPSRYFGEIYSGVTGIDALTVKVQQIANPGDPIVPANWQTTRLPISITQFASTTPVDITVTEV